MTKAKPNGTGAKLRAAALERARLEQKRQLARNLRTERQIQTLARRLDREMQRTNDRLQQLGMTLGSHARALEAERDVTRSLEEQDVERMGAVLS